MISKTTRRPLPVRQLPLYLPAAATPPLDGITRDAIVQLLAHLLTSACTRDAKSEGGDEAR